MVGVFPTHVGVFLTLIGVPVIRESLPHARGGVSFLKCPVFEFVESSPRTWGCFRSFSRSA